MLFATVESNALLAVSYDEAQALFVALLENGTHVLWGAHMDLYATDELTLAEKVIPLLRKGMLCMADRFFPGYKLWGQPAKTGADLLWRTRQNARLDVEKRLPDDLISVAFMPPTAGGRAQWNRGPCDRIPLEQSRRGGAIVPARNHDPRPRAGSG